MFRRNISPPSSDKRISKPRNQEHGILPASFLGRVVNYIGSTRIIPIFRSSVEEIS
jgi:hypothetical protein